MINGTNAPAQGVGFDVATDKSCKVRDDTLFSKQNLVQLQSVMDELDIKVDSESIYDAAIQIVAFVAAKKKQEIIINELNNKEDSKNGNSVNF